MVFMVASTNLVVELGIVLWLLIGWQFALAEFVGGAIMIALLGLVVPRVIPAALDRASPRRLEPADAGAPGSAPHDEHTATTHGDARRAADDRQPSRCGRRMRSRRGWGDAAGYTISDLTHAAQGTGHRLRRRRVPRRAGADVRSGGRSS